MTTTCPVCGTACNIMGDPASVTRWYEPLGQMELESKIHGMTATMQQWRNLAGQMTDERNTLHVQLTRHVDWLNERNSQVDTLKARIVELEAARMAHTCRVPAKGRTVPTLVIEEAISWATLCICGHPLSAHGDLMGCCQVVRPGRPDGIISRYCDCDAFKARKIVS